MAAQAVAPRAPAPEIDLVGRSSLALHQLTPIQEGGHRGLHIEPPALEVVVQGIGHQVDRTLPLLLPHPANDGHGVLRGVGVPLHPCLIGGHPSHHALNGMGSLVGLRSLGQDRLQLTLGEEIGEVTLRLPLQPNGLAEEQPAHLHFREVEGYPLDRLGATHGGRPRQGIDRRLALHHGPELRPLFRAGGDHMVHKGRARRTVVNLHALGCCLEHLLGLRTILAKDRPPYGDAPGHQPTSLPHPCQGGLTRGDEDRFIGGALLGARDGAPRLAPPLGDLIDPIARRREIVR